MPTQEQTQSGTPKLFDLAVIRTDTTQRKLTGYPMTHKECEIMKSKYSDEEQSRIIFVPAHPTPDEDHGPMGNNEASLIREVSYWKEKAQVAQDAQNKIWEANVGLAKQIQEAHTQTTAQAGVIEKMRELAEKWDEQSLIAKSKAELWEDEHPCHSDDHHRAQHQTLGQCARQLREVLSSAALLLAQKEKSQ